MRLALIGRKLSHSYSAFIHELFFNLTGIKGTYELVEIPKTQMLGKRMEFFEKKGYDGINVTIPYKKDVMNLVDFISPEAKAIGAVNTILFRDSKRYAYNTDYFGFKKTLTTSGIDPAGKKWLILGFGGGAKSVLAVLRDMSASGIYITQTSKTGEGIIAYNDISSLGNIYGVVNTTPVGMYPEVNFSPLNYEQLKGFECVIDIIYNPVQTVFLQHADKIGIKNVNGLYMLVAQAVKSQEIWNDRRFDDNLIESIYQELEKKI